MKKAVPAAAKSHKSVKTQLWEQRYLFLLLLPSLIWVILICYAPMTGLYMAFINYTPKGNGYFADLASSQFVGFDWFQYFFSTDFLIIMRNTLATSLLTLLFSFPLPIILAICLNEVKSAGVKKFVQTASYLPYFISWVIAANIFITFLSADGVINHLLMAIGFTDEQILFFQKGSYFWWIIAIANAWKVLGYNAIIYLAAVSGISQDMYEAADVDGATRVQKIWYITLPALKPTIMVLLILAIGGVLNTGFEQQLLMANDSILNYSDVLDTYAYRYGLKNGYGQTGPYASRGCFDGAAQSMSGMVEITGDPDGSPYMTGTYIIDYASALYAAIGTLAALRTAERTGKGQVVDVALLDAAVSLLHTAVPDQMLLGQEMMRNGNNDRYMWPANIYPAKEGRWVYIHAGMEHCYKAILQEMGRMEVLEDAKHGSTREARSSPEGRRFNDEMIRSWTRKHTADEIVERLSPLGIPCAKVNTIREAMEDPQLQHRGMLAKYSRKDGEEGILAGSVPHFSGSEFAIELPPPGLGEHNETVYAALGLSGEEISRLKRDGVI